MSKSRKRRTNFTAVQKIRIVREHLLEDVPISDVCDRQGQRWLNRPGIAGDSRVREDGVMNTSRRYCPEAAATRCEAANGRCDPTVTFPG